MQGHDALLAGSANVVVAGGMESMTNAPYLVKRGLRMGHDQLLDHMFFDGLQNPYDGQMMGQFGEQCVARYGFTREQQDDFARASAERAQAAIQSGAFAKDGTITAASSSKISDGAAAMVLMRGGDAEHRGIVPLARIVAHTTHSQEPEWFTTAPVGAMKKVLDKAGWSASDVDLYEINEAFATVTMAAMHDVGIAHEQVNVNGGACALGHPIGASGARILVTLLHALRKRGGGRGIASLCIGGGEATAIAIELI